MLDQVIKYVVGELSVIAQAPLSFALCLAVIAIGVWRLMVWRYAGSIESLDHRIKLKDDQISDYKNKMSGATPDEAKARLDALELQVKALSPRRLTNEQKETLRNIVSSTSSIIEIAVDAASGDARAFCSDFATAFQTAGWGVLLPMVLGVGSPPPTGMALKVENPAALRPAEVMVKRVLEALNIPFDLQAGLRKPIVRPPLPAGFPPQEQEPAPEVGLLITTRLT